MSLFGNDERTREINSLIQEFHASSVRKYLKSLSPYYEQAEKLLKLLEEQFPTDEALYHWVTKSHPALQDECPLTVMYASHLTLVHILTALEQEIADKNGSRRVVIRY